MIEWKSCFRLFKVRLIDGTKANGYLMRRKVNGEWQYRKETPAEETDQVDAAAI